MRLIIGKRNRTYKKGRMGINPVALGGCNTEMLEGVEPLSTVQTHAQIEGFKSQLWIC